MQTTQIRYASTDTEIIPCAHRGSVASLQMRHNHTNRREDEMYENWTACFPQQINTVFMYCILLVGIYLNNIMCWLYCKQKTSLPLYHCAARKCEAIINLWQEKRQRNRPVWSFRVEYHTSKSSVVPVFTVWFCKFITNNDCMIASVILLLQQQFNKHTRYLSLQLQTPNYLTTF